MINKIIYLSLFLILNLHVRYYLFKNYFFLKLKIAILHNKNCVLENNKRYHIHLLLVDFKTRVFKKPFSN